MLLNQMAAPNSPQWFNTGLNFAYGMTGPAQGHWVTDPTPARPSLADDAYSHPQPHACFIQSVDDDLVNEGGIMDLWVREARLFKYGSGTGTNFSHLRGENEPLSGGGKSSSGLMSFLKIGDRAAGAIKSGGTTRRAAKMVCLDLDHPDIENVRQLEGARGDQGRGAGRGHEEPAQGATRDRRSPRHAARLRLQRRGLRHRQRPELQQLRPHPQRPSSRPSTKTATGT